MTSPFLKFKTRKSLPLLAKKLTVLFCVFSFSLTPLLMLPQKSEAQGVAGNAGLSPIGSVGVGSVGGLFVPTFTTNPEMIAHALQTLAKEGIGGIGLDAIAWQIAKLAISNMTQSLVNWINSGFEGNPAFVTNPLQFFADIADQELGRFLEGTDIGLFCSPFQIDISKALILNHRGKFQREASCKLSDILNNVQNFDDFVSVRDLSNINTRNIGGWEDWYDVAARPEGNIYGAYQAAEAELSLRIRNRQFAFEKELDWGRGFLSLKKCSPSGGGPGGGQPGGGSGATGEGDCQIVTPGAVIEEELTLVLGSGVRQLELADEFNEIIGALLGQLLTQITGGGGLFGLSQPSFDNNGGSYTSQLGAENTIITGSKDLTNEGINQNIQVFDEFVSLKNASIAKVNNSIFIQQSVIACYDSAESAPGAQVNSTLAESTIANDLNPLKADLSKSVSASSGSIEKLKEFRVRLAALSSTDIAGLQQLKVDYLNFLTNAQIDYLVQTAKQEFDFTLPQKLNPIDISGRSTLLECQKFGGGGGGIFGPSPGGPGGPAAP